MINEFTMLRIDKGLSKKALAHEIGVSEASVYNWEYGYRVPRPDKMFKLAKLFEIEPRELFSIFEKNKSLSK